MAFSIKINRYFDTVLVYFDSQTIIRSEEIKPSSIFGEKKRFVKLFDKIMIFEMFILIYLIGEYLKVSLFQNVFMKSSFGPKYHQKI